MWIAGKREILQMLHHVLRTILLTVVLVLIRHVVSKVSSKVPGWEHLTQMKDQQEEIVTYPGAITTTMSDVGGLARAKKEVRIHILCPLMHPTIFKNPNIKLTKGFLFCGKPGTGKTMMVKAICKEANVPLISVTSDVIESKWYGDSPKIVASIFKTAQRIQPCVLFFDEIDGIMRSRREDDQSFVYTMKTQILTLLDGANTDKDRRFVVIACTNNPQSMDPALKRRLPKCIYFEEPTEQERVDILRSLPESAGLSYDHLSLIAQSTPGFTGSDLRALASEVVSCALEHHLKDTDGTHSMEDVSVEVNVADWLQVCSRTKSNSQEVPYGIRDRKAFEKISSMLRSLHESYDTRSADGSEVKAQETSTQTNEAD